MSDIWIDKPGAETPLSRHGLTNREGNMTECDGLVLRWWGGRFSRIYLTMCRRSAAELDAFWQCCDLGDSRERYLGGNCPLVTHQGK